jgi:hypothetical protein
MPAAAKKAGLGGGGDAKPSDTTGEPPKKAKGKPRM